MNHEDYQVIKGAAASIGKELKGTINSDITYNSTYSVGVPFSSGIGSFEDVREGWNPFDNNADAFELIAKLNLSIKRLWDSVTITCPTEPNFTGLNHVLVDNEIDLRRAVTNAAYLINECRGEN